MPTPFFITGFEHKVVTTATGTAVASEKRLWNSISSGPAIETSIVHHGSSALRLTPAAGAEFVNIDLIAGQRRIVGQLWVRFETLPTGANCRVFSSNTVAGGHIIGVDTSGNWFAQAAGGGTVTASAVSTGVWYRIDFDFNSSANPHTTDWQINESAQTQASVATAAEDQNTFTFGNTTLATTADYIIDCAVLSYTGADYPFADEYKVLGYRPNADVDITQVGSGAFVDAGGTAISGGNPAWDNLLALETTTTHVEQTANDGAGYIEIGFENSSESDPPIAVQGESTHRADTSSSNNGQIQVNDGGTLDTFTGLIDFSETSIVGHWECWPVRINGGTAWTDSAFDALTMRIGYSTDAAPDPWFVGLMFEAAFPVAAAAATEDPFPFFGGGYFPTEG